MGTSVPTSTANSACLRPSRFRSSASLAPKLIGFANYLIDNLPVTVTFYDGRPISVEPPPTVDLLIIETEPSLKGASVSNVGKQAKLETGMMVTVPQFISQGEKIRVNTAEGTYMERA